MKIRIKRKLNEGKGADIIARGLKINLLSDLSKRVFEKFGGFEEVIEGDSEKVNQAIELIIGLGSGDRQSMENDSNIFREFARMSEKEVPIKKREYEELVDRNRRDINNEIDTVSRGRGLDSGFGAENDFFVQEMEKYAALEEKKYLSDIKKLQEKVDLYNDIAEKLSQA